ncbi:hypothetical protein AB833_32155 [Chromatiales bacterium (ex Bugula neritina AB1)]|nr:hypothetical protein AB833_32155 [Chromatiales bacterium (ex Bugula neritina AB1)]
MREYIQYSIKTPERTFLCLDTLKPGSDAGELCKSRLDWLSDELQTASDHPVYLFMHHPPMKLGLPMQDTEKVESGDEFLEAIEHSQQLKYMFTDQSLAV